MSLRLRSKIIGIYRKIFGKKIFIKFNKFILKLAFSGLGINNYINMKVSGEKRLLEKLSKYIDKDDVVLDVGAFHGDYAKLVFETTGSRNIFSFEPHPNNFKRLKKEVEDLPIEKFNLGLSDSAGRKKIFDYKENPGSSHASIDSANISKLKGEPVDELLVDFNTVDSFVAERSIRNIKLMKIDVEGHEYKVLQGASNCIEQKKIDFIQFEFNEMNINSRTFLYDFLELLNGYEHYRLLPDGLYPIDPYNPIFHEIFAFQNILSVNEELNFKAS